jgi:diguanylate cyclase (GGDEF)-like protein
MIMTNGIKSAERWKLLDNGLDDILPENLTEDEFVTRIRLGTRIHFLQEEIRQLNLTDPLTGLFNRQYLEQILEGEVNRAARYGEMLCCLLVDCHRFKSINEEYGHACGDAVLRYAAKMLRDIMRDSDMVGRYGEDEFVVILPKTVLESCKLIKSRIKECVASEVFVWNGHEIPLTFRIGAAEFDYNDCNTVSKLLDMAELELERSTNYA